MPAKLFLERGNLSEWVGMQFLLLLLQVFTSKIIKLKRMQFPLVMLQVFTSWKRETQRWSLPPHPLNKPKKAPTASLPARSQNLEAPGSTWDGAGQKVLECWNGEELKWRKNLVLLNNFLNSLQSKDRLWTSVSWSWATSPNLVLVFATWPIRLASAVLKKRCKYSKKTPITNRQVRCAQSTSNINVKKSRSISSSKFQVLVDQWTGQSIRVWLRNT